MAYALPELHLGLRQRLQQAIGVVLSRIDPILAALDHQHRQGERLGVIEAAESRQAKGGRVFQAPDVQTARKFGEPVAQRRAGLRADQVIRPAITILIGALSDAGHPLLKGSAPLRRKLALADAGAAEQQSAHPLGMRDRKGLRHRRSEGIPGDDTGPNIQGLHEVTDGLCVITRLGLIGSQGVAQTIARCIPGNHPPPYRKSSQLKSEVLRIRSNAVQQKQGRAMAGPGFQIRPAVTLVAHLRLSRDASQTHRRQGRPATVITQIKTVIHRLRLLLYRAEGSHLNRMHAFFHDHRTEGACMNRRLKLGVWMLGMLAAFGLVHAQGAEWPTRPVRIIVPYPAGGGVDILARAVAQKLQERWQQPVTVDNRPGANTLVGTEMVAKSTDGHTLLVTTDATFTINPHLYNRLPYDFERDFAPLSRMVSFSQLFVATASLPANNLQELIALARKQPGQLSYASYGAGSQPQLATEMLKQKAGIFIVHIPYRGIPQAVSAVVAGEIPLTWAGIPSARPHLQSKRMKALAYGGKTRHPAFPEVPTVGEQGFPEVDANVWVGLFAPASMPAALRQRIEQEVAAILREPSFKEREIDGKGYDLVGSSGQEMARHIRQELASRAGPIRYSGSKVE